MNLNKTIERQTKKTKRALNREAARVNKQSWERVKVALHKLHPEPLETIIVNCLMSDSKGVKFSQSLLDFWANKNGYSEQLQALREQESIVTRIQKSGVTLSIHATSELIANEQIQLKIALEKLNTNPIVAAFNRIMASLPKTEAILPDNKEGEKTCQE